LACARKGGGVLVVGSGGSCILSDAEEEGRGGEEYRRDMGVGLHSTRRTKTRQVPGSEFDEFATGERVGLLSTFSPIIGRMLSHVNMDGERATFAPFGWPLNSCEEAWRKCVHMSEDVREGRIRTAVHGRFADITKLKAPMDARSSNKKRLGPQGNDYRLAES
jgi:hypothetical protein